MIWLTGSGCEPLVPNDGVSPDMEQAVFNFSVSPDKDTLHVGDTLTLEASIDNDFGNGILIKDGRAFVQLSFGASTHVPQIDANDYYDCSDGDDYNLIVDAGSVEYKGNSGKIFHLYTDVRNDSLKMKYRFIMRKKGMYHLDFQSMYFESSKGKTRTQGYFLPLNHHWHLIQVPDADTPTAGTDGFARNYLFCVQ
jgi:hypothetical protein